MTAEALMTIYCEPAPDAAYPGGSPVHQVADLAALGDVLAADPAVQLVVLGAGVRLDDAMAFAAEQRIRRPALGVVLIRDRLAVDVLALAIRAGIREVVGADDTAGLDAACARSVELSRQLGAAVAPGVPARAEHARTITVFAGKGGVGKSTVATNLAVTLADGGRRRVCLIDLDLQFGDVGILLQLPPERSIADAIAMAGRLDSDAVRSLITRYRPGVDVLLAPPGPAEGDHVHRDLVTELIGAARTMFDYIVVDTPPYVSDQVLAVLDQSDCYVLVVTPDLPTLKSLRLTLDMFQLLDYPVERRLTLLNRADSQVGLTVSDIEQAVGIPMNVLMPSSRDVPVSVNRGVPIALDRPTHPVSVAIRELADRCAGPAQPVVGAGAGRRRRRLFGRGG